jgi:glutamate carboxypeptidase
MKIAFLITAVILGSSFFTVSLNAQETLSDTEKSIIADVDAAFEQQINFLEKVVNISSGSRNLKGVRETGDAFMAEFGQLGFENRWIDMPKEMDRAGHMYSKKTFGKGGKNIMLIGHLDTVFPHDSPFQKFVRNGNKATGPGITDMKDGNVIILYALKALIEGGHLKQGTASVFFTGDEESTGKPLSISRGELIEIAKASDIALNFESGSKGYAVIGRRGSSGWKLEVSGKRAHSAGVFNEKTGAGAIFETSRILNDFYNEVKGEHGLTFNPGVIAGGTFVTKSDAGYTAFGKTNVVAQKVIVKGGLRFLSDEQLQGARAKMRDVVSRHLPVTEASIEFIDSYPAMTETDANRALLAKLSDVSVAMGMEPLKAFDPTKRGAADISFVAPHVTSMDALGGSGGGSHTTDEWADISSIKQATQRTAVFLYRLLNE